VLRKLSCIGLSSDGHAGGDRFVRSVPKLPGNDAGRSSFGLAVARSTFVRLVFTQRRASKKNFLHVGLASSGRSANVGTLLFVQAAGDKPFADARHRHLENSLNQFGLGLIDGHWGPSFAIHPGSLLVMAMPSGE
jgi:hypothetical protein